MHYQFLKSVLAMQGEATDSASANLRRKKILEDLASKLDSRGFASASSTPKASPYQQERKQVLKRDMATLSSLIKPANPKALSYQLSASDWLRLVKIFFQSNKGRFPLDCLVGSISLFAAFLANTVPENVACVTPKDLLPYLAVSLCLTAKKNYLNVPPYSCLGPRDFPDGCLAHAERFLLVNFYELLGCGSLAEYLTLVFVELFGQDLLTELVPLYNASLYLLCVLLLVRTPLANLNLPLLPYSLLRVALGLF